MTKGQIARVRWGVVSSQSFFALVFLPVLAHGVAAELSREGVVGALATLERGWGGQRRTVGESKRRFPLLATLERLG